MKHTKGPWKNTGTAIWTDWPGIPFLVAEVTKPSSDANGIDWEANANLIAAAPEMLKALELVVKGLIDNENPGQLTLETLVRRCQETIAKAKGK